VVLDKENLQAVGGHSIFDDAFVGLDLADAKSRESFLEGGFHSELLSIPVKSQIPATSP
jgi:hypothetical protein